MKKKKGCLTIVVGIAVLWVISWIVSSFITSDDIAKVNEGINKINESMVVESEKEEVQEVRNTDELKEFDSKSWADFVEVNGVWNNYLTALDNFSNGDQLNAYSAIKEYERYFGQKSVSMDYAKNEEQNNYMDVLSIICLDAQSACKNTLKYIDSEEMKHLSLTQEKIEEVKSGINTFVTNRGILLNKAGYTEEEISQIVEKAGEELGQ